MDKVTDKQIATAQEALNSLEIPAQIKREVVQVQQEVKTTDAVKVQ